MQSTGLAGVVEVELGWVVLVEGGVADLELLQPASASAASAATAATERPRRAKRRRPKVTHQVIHRPEKLAQQA